MFSMDFHLQTHSRLDFMVNLFAVYDQHDHFQYVASYRSRCPPIISFIATRSSIRDCIRPFTKQCYHYYHRRCCSFRQLFGLSIHRAMLSTPIRASSSGQWALYFRILPYVEIGFNHHHFLIVSSDHIANDSNTIGNVEYITIDVCLCDDTINLSSVWHC